MRTIGIIAEYNPFHNGHLRQFELLRSACPDTRIIVVMSGDYVQRGEPALLDKYTRTRMALLSGADLVIELPTAFSTASAEVFARGGTGLLNALGVVDAISFGSEEGPSPLFEKVTDLFETEPEIYKESLKKALKSGLSFPAAREKAAQSVLSDSICSDRLHAFLSSPNNILGIEYTRALHRLKAPMEILPLRREGLAYHENRLNPSQLPSASAIRKSLFEGNLPDFAVPPEVYAILKENAEKELFLSTKDLDDFLRYRLLFLDPKDPPTAAGLSPALLDRILNRRFEYTSFEAFADLLKTRELTRSRICRVLLHLILEIHEDPVLPSYIRILGFRRSSSKLISEIRNNAALPVITRPAREVAALDDEARRAFEDNTRCACLYESMRCQKTGDPFVHEYQKSMVLV